MSQNDLAKKLAELEAKAKAQANVALTIDTIIDTSSVFETLRAIVAVPFTETPINKRIIAYLKRWIEDVEAADVKRQKRLDKYAKIAAVKSLKSKKVSK